MTDWVVTNIFYVFETLGICTFAISGLLLAKEKDFDPVGVYIIAFVTALGGGTIRDLLLGETPIYWISKVEYPLLILLLTAIIYPLSKERIHPSWLVVPDAIGLSLFTVTAVETALSVNLSPLIVMILGTISACFGGLLRDILCQEVPLIFQKVSFYSFVAFVGAGIFIALRQVAVLSAYSSFITIAFIISFRLLSYRYNWRFR
ncbi:trimeric intracellular cation channel family protein [Candidatus Marinamargulisbacteria bacterium SCGC AG-439-L15]|nr:trimeric intracellular cation channel family protein [Candidatus Marinamargulisbacteria bacterium SCGC AG-439-L15]